MLDPALMLVLLTALVSALNPYTLGGLILLCTAAYGRGHASGRVLYLGLTYIATLAITSLLGGVGLLYLFSLLPLIATHYFALGIGILVVCAGLLEIKDFFWYGQGLSLSVPRGATRSIRHVIKGRPSFITATGLGLLVAFVIAPASSAPYFATITILRDNFDAHTIGLLALYSIMFTLPMLLVLALVVYGVKVSTLTRWKEEAKGKMRLGVGLLLVALGWIVILISSGVLNFG